MDELVVFSTQSISIPNIAINTFIRIILTEKTMVIKHRNFTSCHEEYTLYIHVHIYIIIRLKITYQ